VLDVWGLGVSGEDLVCHGGVLLFPWSGFALLMLCSLF
jgi:hypothetical protein